jgi:hypothetical protein
MILSTYPSNAKASLFGMESVVLSGLISLPFDTLDKFARQLQAQDDADLAVATQQQEQQQGNVLAAQASTRSHTAYAVTPLSNASRNATTPGSHPPSRRHSQQQGIQTEGNAAQIQRHHESCSIL